MEKNFSINKDGFSVRCKIYCNDIKNVNKAIIYGHGFAGHKDNGTARTLSEKVLKRNKDAAVIVFNWPCHGDDACSKLSLVTCTKYLDILIDYTKNRLKASQLFGCANSFGGYMFLKYISENGSPFIRTALRCPAVNMYDVLNRTIMTEADLALIERSKPVMVGFDRKIKVTKDFLDEVRENDLSARDLSGVVDTLLIIHGTKDEVVSFDYVRSFAQSKNIEFIASEGSDHRFRDPKKLDDALGQIIRYFGLK